MDEERFAEAEVLAKRARELDPENPLVKQLHLAEPIRVAHAAQRAACNDEKEKGLWETLDSVEQSADSVRRSRALSSCPTPKIGTT